MSSFDLHPDMRVLTEANAALPKAETIPEIRRNWSDYARANSRPYPKGMEVTDRAVPTADGGVPVRIYRPASDARDLPGIVYFHGGGFMKGDLDSSDTVAWGFAEEVGAVVVSVDYRLSPEHPYPAAFDDCFAVTAHVHEHAADFAIDPARIAVCGDSAGGNLAAAVSLTARDRGGPPLVAQALIYPVVDRDLTLPSYVENADAPGLTTSSMRWYWEMYLGERAPDPYVVPMTAGDLSGLPPAFVHTAEYDPLRDEGKRYADALAAAGTSSEYRCAGRMIHGFMRARFAGPGAAAEFEAICDFLRRRLKG